MPVHVSHDAERRFAEVRYVGFVTADQLRRAIRQSVTLARDGGVRAFLTDLRDLSVAPSVFDLYAVIRDFAPQVPALGTREALVVAVDSPHAESAQFWETACRNRGVLAQVFRDRESALDWLLAADESGPVA